jgi:tetratricopeptide (TPR) repeat protein
LSDNDDPDSKQHKLAMLFKGADKYDGEGISLLGAYFGLPGAPPEGLLSSESPERKRMILHHLLTRFFIQLADNQPVLVTFEDVHWMDPTTGEFLQMFLTSIVEHRIMAILTFRPEFSAPWGHLKAIASLPLDRLNRLQTKEFIAAFSADSQLPRELMAELIERSDGNPLYIEELTAAVLDDKAQPERSRNRAALVTAPRRIPSTLQESLFARIDQASPDARELIHVCAVIGRRFFHKLLVAVAELTDAKLDNALTELVERGLLQRTGHAPNAEYAFKHALIQDAAYAVILKEKRRRLHERCAVGLEAVSPNDPGVLGHHHELAGNAIAAVRYYLTAGQLAIDRYSLQEADRYLQRGLDLLATLPDSDFRNAQELKFRSLLGRASIFSKGWAHPSVKHQYGRALELSKSIGNRGDQVNLEWALATYHLLHGEIRDAVFGGERVLGLAEQANDPELKHVAHSALTIYHFYAGNFLRSIGHKAEALRFFRAQSSVDLQKKFGTDRRLQALRGAALSYWCLGNHRVALAFEEEQRSAAVKSGNNFDHAYALTISCILHSLRRNAPGMLSNAEAAIRVAEEYGFSFLHANALNFRALALALQDPCEDSFDECDATIERYQLAGNRMGISSMWAILGELCRRLDFHERGLHYTRKGLDYAGRAGERFAQADLYRVRGELLSAVQQPQEAEHCLRGAIALARKQGARTWELRAAIEYSKLLIQRNEVLKARKVLEPLCRDLDCSEFASDDLMIAKTIYSQHDPQLARAN